MNLATAPKIEETQDVDDMDTVVDTAIRRFLDGTSDGHALFEALYGATLDEPIPEHLLALVRGR
jgi:hypothetical protein